MKENSKDIYKCWELESIINCDIIPDTIKQECKDSFDKRCYFGFNDVTKVGILIGLEINALLKEFYYILEDINSSNKYYITCNTRLKRL